MLARGTPGSAVEVGKGVGDGSERDGVVVVGLGDVAAGGVGCDGLPIRGSTPGTVVELKAGASARVCIRTWCQGRRVDCVCNAFEYEQCFRHGRIGKRFTPHVFPSFSRLKIQ